MLAAVAALIGNRKVGVELPRHAWVNLGLVWVGAFAVAGGVTFGLGLWLLVPG